MKRRIFVFFTTGLPFVFEPNSTFFSYNEIVAPVLPPAANHVERGPRMKLKPAQKHEIGKRAAKYGVASSIHHFKGKYQHLSWF